MATMAEHVATLAKALRRAAEEHGRPNTFGCEELHELYGGPPPMIAGKIGTSVANMGTLYEALGGRAKWGSAPQYSNRRFGV